MDSYHAKVHDIIQFLSENHLLLTSHITEAYQKNYFSQIPSDWFTDLMRLPYQTYLSLLSSFSELECPSLLQFLSKAKDLSPSFKPFTSETPISFIESQGMNPKKIHETSRLASLITYAAHSLNTTKIIDLGAGQGYLSHLLVTRSGFEVTAIEGRSHNSSQSEKRAGRIEKNVKTQGKFQAVCKIISSDDLPQYTNDACMLVGLHTCGDLAANSLKLFVSNENIRGIVNVGCCYHHLTEYVDSHKGYEKYLSEIGESGNGRSLDETLVFDADKAGFPMSEYIRRNFRNFLLGRLSRSLCIGDSKGEPSKAAILNFKKLEYRAAFQAFLADFYQDSSKVFALGNKIKKFKDFAEYCKAALNKMQIYCEMSDEQINKYYAEKFQEGEKRISALWTLRSVFSGAIENLIVLDRVLFLQEQGMKVEVYNVFDRGISPRNIAICAFKQ